MKIAFSEIPGTGRTYRINERLAFPDQEVNLEKPVSGSLEVDLQDEQQAVLSGEITTRVTQTCDRCCRQFGLDLQVDFTYECIVGNDPSPPHMEVEVRDEECNRLYVNEPVIDLTEILKEQIYLSLPAQVLCGTSCKGLCPRCGADLNSGSCSCSTVDEHSPFAALKGITGKQ